MPPSPCPAAPVPMGATLRVPQRPWVRWERCAMLWVAGAPMGAVAGLQHAMGGPAPRTRCQQACQGMTVPPGRAGA